MNVYPIADAHTDYLYSLLNGISPLMGGIPDQIHVSRESLQKGNVRLQFFAAFVDSKEHPDSVTRCLELIDQYRLMLDAWGDDIVELTRDNLDDVLANGPLGAVLAIEGGDAINGSLGVLRTMYRLGVRAMTLVWNRENAIATPAILNAEEGLKPFGFECVREMNRLGMAIDVSHLNTRGFWDVIETSTQPILATHSNAKAITGHFRNLDDEQIKAVIAQKGFIGINFCAPFLNEDEDACCLDDMIRHIDHILSLGGEEVLGLGSDWDGIGRCPRELHGAQDFQLILSRLRDAGCSETLIEGIAYKNLARYMRAFL